MSIENKKPALVLNIKQNNFFENHSAKRPLEKDVPFATISSKRPKLGSSKIFRMSKSKAKSTPSKLGIISSLSAMNKPNIFNVNQAEETSKPIQQKSPVKQKSSNHEKVRKPHGKVSFNNSVEILGDQSESKINNNNVQKSKSGVSAGDGSQPFYSSLFSKAPPIPEMNRIDVSSTVNLKTEVFSTNSFKDLNIAHQIVANLEKLGCSSMTMVQDLGITPIMEGRDVLIKSQTGSGKTLAYAVPIVHQLMQRIPKVHRSQGLYALVIVPTRELAIQTYQWMEKLCKACVWVVPGYLMGGEKKKAEKSRLRKGINILVATPGRLTDHINNTNSLSLLRTRYLVLDEADRMLEMGYEQSIKGILYSLNETQGEDMKRQTILLSATLTTAVEKLAGMSLKEPTIVDVTSTNNKLSDNELVTPDNLSHFFMMVPPKLRLVALAAFILEKCKFTDEKKMMIFMTTQDMVDFHTSLFSMIISRIGRKRDNTLTNLQKEGNSFLENINLKNPKKNNLIGKEVIDDDEEIDEVSVDDLCFFKLHGNMSQPERTAVFKSFCDASAGVMLTTDVASRGLDLPRVNWIVQYNAACGASEYVHRVGRTARASAEGSAIVFINPTESAFISMLEKQGIKFNDVNVKDVLATLTKKSLYHEDVERIPGNMESAATFLQNEFEDVIAEDSDMHAMALQGYVSFVRSYAAIPKDLRDYFCFKLLHLGHYAKSFGLRETPAVLGNKGLQNKSREFRSKEDKEREYVVRRDKDQLPQPSSELFTKKTIISEFDSGLNGIDEEQAKKTKKKKVLSNKLYLKKKKGKA